MRKLIRKTPVTFALFLLGAPFLFFPFFYIKVAEISKYLPAIIIGIVIGVIGSYVEILIHKRRQTEEYRPTQLPVYLLGLFTTLNILSWNDSLSFSLAFALGSAYIVLSIAFLQYEKKIGKTGITLNELYFKMETKKVVNKGMKNSQYTPSIENGELIIQSKKNNKQIYRGKIDNTSVQEVINIPKRNLYILLLDSLANYQPKSSNLLCIDPFGNIIWRVQKNKPLENRPFSSDHTCYTGMNFSVEKNAIIAYDFEGYSDEIDVITGVIINSEFVK